MFYFTCDRSFIYAAVIDNSSTVNVTAIAVSIVVGAVLIAGVVVLACVG